MEIEESTKESLFEYLDESFEETGSKPTDGAVSRLINSYFLSLGSVRRDRQLQAVGTNQEIVTNLIKEYKSKK